MIKLLRLPIFQMQPQKEKKIHFCVSNIAITKNNAAIIMITIVNINWNRNHASAFFILQDLTDKFLPFGLSGRRGIVVACVCAFFCPSVRELYFAR